MQFFVKHTAARFALYTAMFFLLAGFVNLTAKHGDPDQFQEGGVVEWAQLSLTSAALLMLLMSAGLAPASERGFPLALAGVMGMAVIRESDAVFCRMIPFLELEWKLPFTLMVGAVAWTMWRWRRTIPRQLTPFMDQAACVLFWAGLCAVIYAQMTGHERYWLPLLKEFFIRDVKRVNEETIEILGHLFLFAGGMEYLVSTLRRQRKISPGSAA